MDTKELGSSEIRWNVKNNGLEKYEEEISEVKIEKSSLVDEPKKPEEEIMNIS